MKNNIQKIVLSAIVVIAGAIFILAYPSFAHKAKQTSGLNSNPISEKKSITLYNKIKQYSDSSMILKYSYTMDYEFDDSTKESYSGVNYKGKNISIDSNAVQFTFNDAREFFSINHKTALAVYSDLIKFREELSKHKTQTQLPSDSFQLNFTRLNGLNFSDSLMSVLVDKDRSYEDNNKIVIDVDFIEDSPLLSYYLVFNKNKQMTDSLIVKLTQMDDIDAPDSEENNNNDVDYYRDLVVQESLITFKAFDFQKGHFAVENLLHSYVTTKEDEVKLVGYKNYQLTVLK